MNYELFLYIEQKGSVTAADVAEKFSIRKESAATILSRFTNYTKDGIRKHYLIHDDDAVSQPRDTKRMSRYGPKSKVRGQGSYRIGPDWWGELKGYHGVSTE